MKARNKGSIIIITHTDLDGIVSASIYLNSIMNNITSFNEDSVEVHFAEPHNLHSLLKDFAYNNKRIERIAIMDLGPNSVTFNQVIQYLATLREQGAVIEWFDHHRWDKEWFQDLHVKVKASVYVETDTCAAGVVFRHVNLPDDKRDCLEYLMEATCAADIWTWDHPMAPMLYRVTSTPKGPKGDSMRRMLLEKMFSCQIWDDEWTYKLEEVVDKELKGYSIALSKSFVIKIDESISIVFILKEKEHPPTSFIASFLMKRKRANIAVIVRKDGALSLRSMDCDVRNIAVCLGGGGHPRASGAKIVLPIYYGFVRFVFPPLYKRLLRNRVIKEVKKCIQIIEDEGKKYE